jgi:NCS1 family nucleobase:cation symporter-1
VWDILLSIVKMSFLKKLEVASETELTRWINDDIKPIEASRRTWTFWTFHNYCKRLLIRRYQFMLIRKGILVNSNISTYLTGSSLIALGLTWWQAIICVFLNFSKGN